MTQSKIHRSEDRAVVVLSNRLPFAIKRGPQGLEKQVSPGGLVSALEPVLRKRGGTWIGWPGISLKTGETLNGRDLPYSIQPVAVSEEELEHYYHGFSNRTLWPLLHSFSQNTQFAPEDFKAYEQVNRRFGETAAKLAGSDDMIWIHDYHLMLAPSTLRARRPKATIAFFLHTPFPSYDIFRLLPWDQELLQGLLDCDLIGFHIESYVHNFLDCVERRLGAHVDRQRRLVHYGDRTIRVDAFPIGIDFALYEQAATLKPLVVKAVDSPQEPSSEQMILGVDRLDYTKGIPERIRAFEHFLEHYPEQREKVTLLQVAVPSRSEVSEYQELKREIDALVGQVNGRFATASWSPIRYLYGSFEREELAALYREAQVALVTPLRDGMNLVAKEFVACQVEDPGVLILSRMAGAADTMHEALLVNPYNLEETAAAIHRALSMEENERGSRMAALRSRERRNNVERWVRRFLEASAIPASAPEVPSHHEFQTWLGPFLHQHRLALFVDYDGTLTPLCEHPAKATLSEDMRLTLRNCAARPDTDITVISGRALNDVQEMVGLSEITYSGNHGLEINGAHIPHFQHEDLDHYSSRTVELAKSLHEIIQGGAWLEEKAYTLTLHVRAMPQAEQESLLTRAREIIHDAGFQARDAHCALEARPPIGWDKGRAVLHILRTHYGPSWSEHVRVIYLGDDQTDEDAFRFLAGLAMTFRVGPANTLTAASRRLPNVSAVEALLNWIASRPEAECL